MGHGSEMSWLMSLSEWGESSRLTRLSASYPQ